MYSTYSEFPWFDQRCAFNVSLAGVHTCVRRQSFHVGKACPVPSGRGFLAMATQDRVPLEPQIKWVIFFSAAILSHTHKTFGEAKVHLRNYSVSQDGCNDLLFWCFPSFSHLRRSLMAQPCPFILPFWERRRNIWFSSSYSWHADAWLRRTLATQVIGLQVYDVSESSNFQAGGDAISGDSTWLHLSLKVIFRLPGHHSVKVQEVMATCGRAVIALMHWQPCRWTRKMPTGAPGGSI